MNSNGDLKQRDKDKHVKERTIQGKTLMTWKNELPMLEKLCSYHEVLWLNPQYDPDFYNFSPITLFDNDNEIGGITISDVVYASLRLERFAPFIEKAFPITENSNGIIESPLREISGVHEYLKSLTDTDLPGKLLLKCDHLLPISGSVKARGGIYEVLTHAERLASDANIITPYGDYRLFDSDEFRTFFSNYTLIVGSTGNLGLSIGIIGKKLGFNVDVHMSSDALPWKKDMLRELGANVYEHDNDYNAAVNEARKHSFKNSKFHFVDDENSRCLFIGYSVAAIRLKKQLFDMGITIDENNPLFVYIPCGVGGAPGGIAYGLKLVFGKNVHCWFAEPTHSPCMLLGCMCGLHDKISVHDFGLDNVTKADGLAIGRASGFVGRTIEPFLSGIYTIDDDKLYKYLAVLSEKEDLHIEPSAAASMDGMLRVLASSYGQLYLKKHKLNDVLANIVHISWSTGGSLVPSENMKEYYKKGKELL